MVCAGLADAEKTNREILSVGGAKGFSTFLGYYTLSAIAESGDYDGAIEAMKQYWGGMLDMVRRPSGRISISTGWKIPGVLTSSFLMAKEIFTATSVHIVILASVTAFATAGVRPRSVSCADSAGQ